MSIPIENFRNLAIIAHVDHGKTTLVDRILQQSGCVDNQQISDRVMDSNALEQERGITILAKATSVDWGGFHLNIVDTPGHGDFGGEVERILSMVDGVVLLVDSAEGPMAQTKFVLSKALKKGLLPIVIINKVDRPDARIEEVETEIFDLFVSLDANDHQMNYPTLYGSGREGWVSKEMSKKTNDLKILLETIIERVPPPKTTNGSFSMLVTTLDYDQHLGRVITGRVMSGKVSVGDKLKAINMSGAQTDEGSVIKVLARRGTQKIILDQGVAGDIITLAGFAKCSVADTLCAPDMNQALPSDPIDPPVLRMEFQVNNSPLNGREGTLLTANQIRDRLMRESQCNVALQWEKTSQDNFEVRGRGELQLGILLENMRREGFELAVSSPQVVFKVDPETHEKLEPYEEATIDVDEEYSSSIIDAMSQRRGELVEIKTVSHKSRICFIVPARALIGIRAELNNLTRGAAVLNHLFHSYRPYCGQLNTQNRGDLVSTADGIATSYSLEAIEPRGTLYIAPGTPVYAGMVIGESSREADVEVNPVRSKHLTNFRASGKEEMVRLTPPKVMSLEQIISYVKDDQLIEITPKTIRLRKKILDPNEREKMARITKQQNKK